MLLRHFLLFINLGFFELLAAAVVLIIGVVVLIQLVKRK